MTVFNGPSGEVVTSNGSAAGDAFVSAYAKACDDYRVAMDKWLRELRDQGITTAAPDDGWVDRQENSWTPPSYADMIGIINEGTRIALGTPDRFRIVKVTRARRSPFGFTRYFFENETSPTASGSPDAKS